MALPYLPPARLDPIGARLITSTPQAAATSTTPEATKLVAMLVACWDEPHWESTVVQAVVTGRPAVSQAGAGDVERLGADLADAPSDDLLDLGRVDAGALDHGGLHGGQQVGRVEGGQSPVALPDGAAHGLDDDDLAHAPIVGDVSVRNRA